MKSFYDFMFGNFQRSSDLFCHFRVLSINFASENDSSVVLMLAAILSHSTRLEILELDNEITRGRNGPPEELITALKHLSHLHSLDVADATDITLDWVKEVDAPLSKLTLLFYTGDTFEPLPELLRFGSILTKLCINFVSLLTGPTSSFCFPHVYTLEVGLLEITPAAVVFRIFPNLKDSDVRMHLEGDNDPPGNNMVHQDCLPSITSRANPQIFIALR